MKMVVTLNKEDDSMVELWSENKKYLWAVVHRGLFESEIYQLLDMYGDIPIELVSLLNELE